MNKEKAILILLFICSLILGLLTIYTFKLEDRIEKLEEEFPKVQIYALLRRKKRKKLKIG